MWRKVTNGSDNRPPDIDDTTSRAYIYVRRNITRVEATGEGEEAVGAHYEWEELKIPREMWEIARAVFEHTEELEAISGAIMELAEIVGGENNG